MRHTLELIRCRLLCIEACSEAQIAHDVKEQMIGQLRHVLGLRPGLPVVSVDEDFVPAIGMLLHENFS